MKAKWSDSRFSFVPFRIGLSPRFWDGGPFGASRQYAHKNGLTFTWAKSSDGRLIALAGRVGAFYMTKCKRRRVRGRGLLAIFCRSFPPASEREARMDDPTRRCANDTDNGTRLLGAPGPKREPHFFCH